MSGAVAAVVLAATPRPRAPFAPCWARLAGRPVVAWSLDVLSAAPAIAQMLLVVSPSRRASASDLVRASGWPAARVVAVPQAGATWVGQVRAALEALAAIASTCSHLLVHDGARPLLSSELLDALLAVATADERTIAVAGVPVKETLKLVDARGDVRQTPPRADLRQLQSPIVLPRAPLAAALATLATPATLPPSGDLAALLAACAGCRMRLIPGSYDNLRIRTPRDLAIAEGMLRSHVAPPA